MDLDSGFGWIQISHHITCSIFMCKESIYKSTSNQFNHYFLSQENHFTLDIFY